MVHVRLWLSGNQHGVIEVPDSISAIDLRRRASQENGHLDLTGPWHDCALFQGWAADEIKQFGSAAEEAYRHGRMVEASRA
jgi:hypothetical protein